MPEKVNDQQSEPQRADLERTREFTGGRVRLQLPGNQPL